MPYSVFTALVKHPLTDIGLKRFLDFLVNVVPGFDLLPVEPVIDCACAET